MQFPSFPLSLEQGFFSSICPETIRNEWLWKENNFTHLFVILVWFCCCINLQVHTIRFSCSFGYCGFGEISQSFALGQVNIVTVYFRFKLGLQLTWFSSSTNCLSYTKYSSKFYVLFEWFCVGLSVLVFLFC